MSRKQAGTCSGNRRPHRLARQKTVQFEKIVQRIGVDIARKEAPQRRVVVARPQGVEPGERIELLAGVEIGVDARAAMAQRLAEGGVGICVGDVAGGIC